MIDVTVRLADGRQVGAIEIHCIEGTGRTPDAINTDLQPRAQAITIRHRYGDSWTVLIKEVLQAIEVRNA